MEKCGECGQVIIEKGIPVPPNAKEKWRFLDDMEIGDSLIVTTAHEFEKVRGSMYNRGIKYRSRKEPNGTGYRLWRIG